MAHLDVHFVLKNLGIFSDKEVQFLFRQNSMIFNPVAIRLGSEIDNLQMRVNYNMQHKLSYEQISEQLDTLRDVFRYYEEEQNVKFAHKIVRHQLAKGVQLYLLDAYYSCLLRTPPTAKVSRKYQQLIQFAQYAMPQVRDIQAALSRATAPTKMR